MRATDAKRRRITAGRAWGYIGVALGLVTSFLGNLAAVSLDGTPVLARVLTAVLAPVGLFVAIEIMARNPWTGWRRTVAWLLSVPIGLTAAAVSYMHLRHLILATGGTELEANLTPIFVDFLIALGTAALLLPTHQPEPVRPIAAITAYGETHDTLMREMQRLAAAVERRPADPIYIFGPEPQAPAKPVVKVNKVSEPPKPRPKPNRTRLPLTEHPLHAAWLEAENNGQPWDNARMTKELQKINPAATDAAARALRNRFRAHATK